MKGVNWRPLPWAWHNGGMRLLQGAVTDCRPGSPSIDIRDAHSPDGLGGRCYYKCGIVAAGEATSGCSLRLLRWWPCLLSLTTLASDFYHCQLVHRTAFSRHCRVDVVTSSVVWWGRRRPLQVAATGWCSGGLVLQHMRRWLTVSTRNVITEE